MITEPRIRHPRKYEDLFSLLSGNADSVFASKAQVLLFAAAIGFKEGKRTAFSDKESLEPIRMATFEHLGRNFQTVLNTLAVAETKDTKILSPDKFDERVLIFEEYACTGLEVLRLRIEGQNSQLDSVINLITEQQQEDDEADDVFNYL